MMIRTPFGKTWRLGGGSLDMAGRDLATLHALARSKSSASAMRGPEDMRFASLTQPFSTSRRRATASVPPAGAGQNAERAVFGHRAQRQSVARGLNSKLLLLLDLLAGDRAGIGLARIGARDGRREREPT